MMIETLEKVLQRQDMTPSVAYRLAWSCSWAASAAKKEEAREAYRKYAVVYLEKAEKGGFLGTSDRVADFRREPQWKPVKEHPGFRGLMERLDKAFPPG